MFCGKANQNLLRRDLCFFGESKKIGVPRPLGGGTPTDEAESLLLRTSLLHIIHQDGKKVNAFDILRTMAFFTKLMLKFATRRQHFDELPFKAQISH